MHKGLVVPFESLRAGLREPQGMTKPDIEVLEMTGFSTV